MDQLNVCDAFNNDSIDINTGSDTNDIFTKIANEIKTPDKLYIKSRDSDIHLGSKFVFAIQNEKDLEKLGPLIKSLSFHEPTIINENEKLSYNLKTDISDINNSGNLPHHFETVTADVNEKNEFTFPSHCSAESLISTDGQSFLSQNHKSLSKQDSSKMDLKSVETKPLLTPDYFEHVFSQLPSQLHIAGKTNNATASVKTSAPIPSASLNISSNSNYEKRKFCPFQLQNITPSNTITNAYVLKDSRDNSPDYSDDFFFGTENSLKENLYPKDFQNPVIQNTRISPFSPKSLQPSFSLPSELHDHYPTLANYYRIKSLIVDDDELPRERMLRERKRDDWIPLGRNYMEARNFRLGVIPGDFYNIFNGILVEMKNWEYYDIIMSNGNKEPCDVDLYVDTHVVAKLRLEGNSSIHLDGPRNASSKFIFIRAFDAPPEAQIIYQNEGNGLIQAVFKPEKIHNDFDERKRAWSDGCTVTFPQTLQQVLDSAFQSGSPNMLKTSSTPSKYKESSLLRSGQLCSGATALQGKQREKYFEPVHEIEIDKKRITSLELRLVARDDDDSQPKSNEPIEPLISKRPPPMPF